MPKINSPHVLTRRSFLDRSLKIGGGCALATLADIPFVMKRALAESPAIGRNGKKLLFIFLRGANDALNSVIPVLDPAYAPSRPTLRISTDPALSYDTSGACLDIALASASAPTYQFPHAIPLGNGFAALHPSLRFLAGSYNAGQMALVHRVGYRGQNRSHFESQANWESGVPNANRSDGIFYRTLAEGGLVQTRPLSGISIQSALPLLFQGREGALTNIADPTELALFGVPGTEAGKVPLQEALRAANDIPFPSRENRELLHLHYRNLLETQNLLAGVRFDEASNTFLDDQTLDGESEPYHLFPTTDAKNGGSRLHGNDRDKFVVDPAGYGFFRSLKAAAQILTQTDAVIAGTEIPNWDTHVAQGSLTGAHPTLLRYLGWALHAVRKFFLLYGRGGPRALPGAQAGWEDVVVVTLSEFGRTTIQNDSMGTDHAEGGLMIVAGGLVKGFHAGLHRSGVYGGHPADTYRGIALPWQTGPGGSMFGVSGRYLKRIVDFRSVLGELIRDHLGATPAQLNRIIPAYADPAEALLNGGVSADGTPLAGELDLI